MMNKERISHVLRGFDPDGIDVQNLRLGRITRLVMREAMKRHGMILTRPTDDLRLAEELNDMLQAARESD